MTTKNTPNPAVETKREHAPNAAIVESLADTFVMSAGKLADRVRYVARIEREANAAGEVVNWKSLAAMLQAARPTATGISPASLSKARQAALLLSSDDGLGRPLSGFRDSTVADALRIVQDAPKSTREEIVKSAREVIAALPEHAPAEVITEAIADALDKGTEAARVARSEAREVSADKRADARRAAEEAAEAAEEAAREAVAGITAEVTPEVLRSPVATVHVLDMLGAAAIALSEANDLGTLIAAENALRGMLADVARYRDAVETADAV